MTDGNETGRRLEIGERATCTRCGWSDAPAGPVDAEADQA